MKSAYPDIKRFYQVILGACYTFQRTYQAFQNYYQSVVRFDQLGQRFNQAASRNCPEARRFCPNAFIFSHFPRSGVSEECRHFESSQYQRHSAEKNRPTQLDTAPGAPNSGLAGFSENQPFTPIRRSALRLKRKPESSPASFSSFVLEFRLRGRGGRRGRGLKKSVFIRG